MKTFVIILFLAIPSITQAGDRLKGIAGSINDSPSIFSKWFADDNEKSDEEKASHSTEQAKQALSRIDNEAPQHNKNESNCHQEKVYSLDVKHPEQYQRLEDYPFTYECVSQR